jgi:hypothetical protein
MFFVNKFNLYLKNEFRKQILYSDCICKNIFFQFLTEKSLLNLLEKLENAKILISEKIPGIKSAMPFEEDEDGDEGELTYYECTANALELTAKLLHNISDNNT